MKNQTRKDGYYWVKSSEKISDHGGHAENEWLIVEFYEGTWLYTMAVSDQNWKEIDETPVTREPHKIASRAVVINKWANSGDVRCYEWKHPMSLIFASDERYNSEIAFLDSGDML